MKGSRVTRAQDNKQVKICIIRSLNLFSFEMGVIHLILGVD